MDTDYKSDDLYEIVNEAENLNNGQQKSLKILLKKYKDIFNVSLGDSNVPPIKFDVKESTKPVNNRPFPVTRIRKETLYRDIYCMVALNILN